MRVTRQIVWSGIAFVALLCVSVTPAQAQGKSKAKHYAVSRDKALSVSRSVLIQRGFHVVRVERVGPTQVIYFRRGNNGRGKGKGPLQRMVIRTVRERVYFEEAEPSVLIDIDVRLKL